MTRSFEVFLIAVLCAFVIGSGCNAIFGLDEGKPLAGGGGAGGIGECTEDTECDDGNLCSFDTCVPATRTCLNVALNEVPASEQTDEDCQRAMCVNGELRDEPDDEDAPDATDCGSGTCIEGTVVYEYMQLGNVCADGVCDGEGSCVECNGASDCTLLEPDSECGMRACNDNVCEFNAASPTTPLAVQIPGNCQTETCGGLVPEGTDVFNDNEQCTNDVCNGITPENPNAPMGTLCGNGLQCDNNGNCSGCTSDGQCPTDTACVNHSCNMGTGFCQSVNFPDGTNVSDPSATDCLKQVCITGNPTIVADNTETPPSDGNDCTQNNCLGGTAVYPPQPLNFSCMGNMFCNGNGACVQCTAPQQCPPGSNECVVATCLNNICGTGNVPNGTPTMMQFPGDCKRNECQSGNVTPVNYDTDTPNDSNECTIDGCSSGNPTYMNTMQGSQCMGTKYCDAGGCYNCVFSTHCSPMWTCQMHTCTPPMSTSSSTTTTTTTTTTSTNTGTGAGGTGGTGGN